MVEDRWERASELFDAALEVPDREREAWIEARTRDDPGLRRAVQKLLAAHERHGGVLDRPVVAPRRSPEVDPEAVKRRLAVSLAGDYEVVRELGRGGMAIVFLAWERKHDRRVVLKVLRPAVAAEYGVERFAREVRIASKLSHPHILGLIDSGSADGLLYYVMPYVEGESLRDRLRHRGTLPMSEVLTLLRDVASALAYAHGQSVVHRDLKPDNVLCAGAHAFLMDFGIAKSVAQTREVDTLTRTGHAIGTPRYMAPEQLTGSAEVDHRADLYAWGLIAYELLTGTVPPLPSSAHASDSMGRRAESAIRTERPDAPAALSRLVARCLIVDPGERLSDAKELVEELDAMSGPVRPRPRRIGLWTAAGLVLLAIAIVELVISIRDGAPAGPGAVVSASAPSVAVAAFANETGDSTLAVVGRMAGDWITQGLQQTGRLTVVPWPTALEASQAAAAEGTAGRSVDPVAALHARTGAGLVITGTVYRIGDAVQLRAEVADAERGEVIAALEPINAPLDSVESAILALRARLMSSLAIATDEQLQSVPALVRNPPTYEAYRAFDRGRELHQVQEYRRAAPEFLHAYALDTTFTPALVYAASAIYNTGEYERVDSLLAEVAARRGSLTEYDDQRFQWLQALLRGDGEAALRTARRAAELAPNSRAAYNVAYQALRMNRPYEALAVLDSLDPDRPILRGWAAYWTQLTHALHMVGDHLRELEAARELRRRHPERRIGLVLEARALAALGRTADVDRAIESAAGLPPTTYWSQGAALVVAGEELQAHGDRAAGRAYLERGIEWLQEELAVRPGVREHRYWLGSAQYDLGRWDEAARTFLGLVEDFPDHPEYRDYAAISIAWTDDLEQAKELLGEPPRYKAGTHAAYRARIAAIEGQADLAISSLRDALTEGVDGFPWLHASAWHDFQRLSADPRFQQILRGDVPPTTP